ncbi:MULTISPECIES: glycosyltransferase family 2 protein [unclassified Tolypothrix]|uniref:glycosyltransferase family 2 protein n=1 Tax=unclassified Tolypothrix TaxID=2649714 RepID=UPI0005EABA53|nr:MULTISPECIES: glycosyltransferase family 2 protein [unclassified Tolypothrix]BAY92849.1 family 2 glycosyl transferase [Microchaete diplosiphon NIES-3275]EKF02933.1 glycosyltransferase, group 2 family protein [Tolypothrix sp. PCC 7601]MBE9086331.1 glycosyltransferase family 2 protein [Tolypothrix sp. LEGE 11397]UYD26764.1 glycosyltransferase family 2 protein [Tolypothrix sp. PCC 7712]UYD37379.1 glycosyltransferase family 2 protein [Tolypothrix sp. PCC 7601]
MGNSVVGENVFFSVVIPTYNRKLILEKCLRALEVQDLGDSTPITGYEVVLVDDGSTDGTLEWLAAYKEDFPHVRCFEQNHQGPAAARNLGVEKAQGDTIIFIDSDLVVLSNFLQAHAEALLQGQKRLGSDRFFTYGAVINTANFEHPTSEPYKVTDFSAAFFATGNVAIPKHWLEKSGLFDTRFQLYGWEDLELGVRLKNLGLQLIKCPAAVGYHWHPAFRLEQIPNLIDKEIQRGRMGVLFYQKHPTWEVRMMIQMTWIHRLLWGILSINGALNERTMAPFLQWLINLGKPQLALEVARIFLNWYNVKGVYEAYAQTQKAL